MKDEIAALQNLLQQENKKMSALQKDRDEFAQIALDRGKNLTVIKTCILGNNDNNSYCKLIKELLLILRHPYSSKQILIHPILGIPLFSIGVDVSIKMSNNLQPSFAESFVIITGKAKRKRPTCKTA